MRPMTVREALQIVREYPLCDDGEQARRIMDAVVEWREASKKYYADLIAAHRRCATQTREQDMDRLVRIADESMAAMYAAESKLASLERGEEPQA